jgi:hypothetical protein
MDAHCDGYPVHPRNRQRNPNTINTGCTMQALTLIIVNLMAMAIYIPYLLNKERKYDNQTDTASKPIRTGHIHHPTTSQ